MPSVDEVKRRIQQLKEDRERRLAEGPPRPPSQAKGQKPKMSPEEKAEFKDWKRKKRLGTLEDAK